MPVSSRVGYPGTIVALDEITAANNNKNPGGIIGYAAHVTGGITATTASNDTQITAVTVTLGVGRIIRVAISVPSIDCSGAVANVAVRLLKNGSYIGETCAFTLTASSTGSRCSGSGYVTLDSGAGGSTVFSAELHMSGSGATLTLNDSNDGQPGPCTLIVEDCGIWF